MATKNDYEKIYIASIIFAVVILLGNLYYYCHPGLRSVGLTFEPLDYLMLIFHRGGIFSTPLKTKTLILVIFCLCSIVRSGKGAKVAPAILISVGVTSLVLYVLPYISSTSYLLFTITGLVGMTWTFAMIGRLFTGFHEHGNDLKESFQQETEPVRNDWSVNLPMKYYFQKRWHDGWISVINPFRGTLIVGSAGSGKSFSVFNPYIEQMIAKGYTMMLYDFKMPDLTKVVYNALERNKGILERRFGKCPQFYCINFKDPVKSNRCNPLAPEYLEDVIDASETARVVMEALNKGNQKKDFFWMSAQQYIGICLWFLRKYTPPGKKQGAWCDFPHMIELINQDYKKVLSIVKKHPSLGGKARVFIDALEADAQDQLQGQIASARIPLNDIASPALYWILSGNDFSLDINDPDEPKILCIGNDPDRQQVYGAALSLFTFRVIKRVNQKGRVPCALVMDELPTISVQGLDNLMATARSNKVAVVLGVQDVSQIVADYGDKTAEKIIALPANVFVGASSVKTAEKYSKEFGKEFRRQESQTRSSESESLSISFHEEEIMPIRKITSLPQGTFIGKVAVENGSPIEQPFFCGAIQIDMEEYAEKKKQELDIPMISRFDMEPLHSMLRTPGIASEYLRRWIEAKLKREWMRKEYSADEFDAEVDKRLTTLTDEQMENMIREATPELEKMEINDTVERNFYNIIGDIEFLIETEYDSSLPDIDYQEQEVPADDAAAEASPRKDPMQKNLDTDIQVLGIPAKVRQTLIDAGLSTLGDIVALSPEQLSGIEGIGPKSIQTLEKLLSSYKLTQGMDISAYGYTPTQIDEHINQ